MEGEVPEVERTIAALYGPERLLSRGVLHVGSAIRAADGRLHAIKIGPHAPKSATDFFVLNLARAIADAILTTGAILRAEPELQHALRGPHAEPLERYRRSALGKSAAPLCAILTRARELPLAHPVWGDGTQKVVLTTPAAATSLATALDGRAEVIALEPLDARVACGLLQARGHGMVSIEAGPSTTGPLYEVPSLVDELWLSLYEEPLADDARGGSLPLDDALFAQRTCVADAVRREQSGRWRFQRWVNRPAW